MLKIITLIACVFVVKGQNSTHLPVVLWHEMGGNCCTGPSTGKYKDWIQEVYPGTFVKSLKLGDRGIIEDIIKGFLANMNTMVDEVCQKIADTPELQNGYNAVGFSQGGHFLRAVAQRCYGPPMKGLISLGGAHQGVFGIPGCMGDRWELCDIMRELLTIGAYLPNIQQFSVQAQYWHDPTREDEYREKNIFMADLNQENFINETYKEQLQRLDNFVMVRFEDEVIIQPAESSWFGFYYPGDNSTIYTLQESELYLEDKLRLRAMDEAGKLHFLMTEGGHMNIPEDWFKEVIVRGFL